MFLDFFVQMNIKFKADLDGDGTLNIDEFVTIAVHIQRISSGEQLKQAFNSFDKNQSGYIEFEELREALFEGHQGSNTEKLIHDIIFDADLDKVTPLNFIKYMLVLRKNTEYDDLIRYQ